MDLTKLPSSEYIKETSKEYSIYVCESRAIPRVTDGFKDGQRKALWLMRNRSEKIKTVSLSGELIASNLYLHGDASASEAISALAAPYKNNIPLLDGEGTFGTKVAPGAWAAPRYTYVRRGTAATNLVYPDLDLVPLRENYDGSTTEPVTFLPVVPLILLNAVSGIAVGWSTEILPRSLKDLIRATIQALNNQKITALQPSYAQINQKIEKIGDNSYQFTGTFDRLDAKTIHVTDLPVDLTCEKFVQRLIKLQEDGTIQDFDDESTEEISIYIKFKRGMINNWSDEKIINVLKLQTKKTERIVCIDWSGKAIRQYESAEQLVEDFVEWRFKYYVERYKKLLADAQYQLQYWEAYKLCFDGQLPADLHKIKNRADLFDRINLITSALNLSDKQLDSLVNLSTYRWTNDYYDEALEKIQTINGEIADYQDHLAHPDKIRDVFKREVKALEKLKL